MPVSSKWDQYAEPAQAPNTSYAKPGPYTTSLSPQDEGSFQSWVKQNKAPFDPSPNADYDMRGYWKDNQGKMQGTKVSQFDGQLHFPDTYKTPYHRTFSNESKYALPTAPHWDGDRLISNTGSVVADETPKAASAGPSKWEQYAEPPPNAPPSHPISDFVGNFADAVNPLPAIKALATHPIDTAANAIHAQVDQFRQARHALTDNIEMPALSDRLMSAGGHALAGALPLVGPAAAQAGEQIGSGDVAGGLGRGAGMLASMAAPSAVKGLGAAVKAPAGPIAETALGVRNVDRAYGKTPGHAILTETKGFGPSTIAESARGKSTALSSQLEKLAANSTEQADLQPARDVIGGAAAKAANKNAGGTLEQLVPMYKHLTENVVSRQPIAQMTTPSNLLNLKRGFGDEFIHNWNPETMQGVKSTGAKAYRALDDELDRTVPEGKDLNQRISSLIPVGNRAAATDLNANGLQRTMSRFARPTGALTGAAAGAIEGARLHGPIGGLVGGAVGLGLPELISSPTAQMIAARGLYGAGKGLQGASPVIGNATRVLPLVKRPGDQKNER